MKAISAVILGMLLLVAAYWCTYRPNRALQNEEQVRVYVAQEKAVRPDSIVVVASQPPIKLPKVSLYRVRISPSDHTGLNCILVLQNKVYCDSNFETLQSVTGELRLGEKSQLVDDATWIEWVVFSLHLFPVYSPDEVVSIIGGTQPVIHQVMAPNVTRAQDHILIQVYTIPVIPGKVPNSLEFVRVIVDKQNVVRLVRNKLL